MKKTKVDYYNDILVRIQCYNLYLIFYKRKMCILILKFKVQKYQSI